MKIDISDQDIDKLQALRKLCVEDDLLDLQADDSIERSFQINKSWEALKVIETLLDNQKKSEKEMIDRTIQNGIEIKNVFYATVAQCLRKSYRANPQYFGSFKDQEDFVDYILSRLF